MLKVLSGNKAAVYGAKLARVEVAAVYPITPQSQISEDITKVGLPPPPPGAWPI